MTIFPYLVNRSGKHLDFKIGLCLLIVLIDDIYFIL